MLGICFLFSKIAMMSKMKEDLDASMMVVSRDQVNEERMNPAFNVGLQAEKRWPNSILQAGLSRPYVSK